MMQSCVSFFFFLRGWIFAINQKGAIVEALYTENQAMSWELMSVLETEKPHL